jgi:hypothetical protein
VAQKYLEKDITPSWPCSVIDYLSHLVERLPIGAEETPYLIVILDCLVKNRAFLETCDVDVNRQFLKELEHSVDLMLRADAATEEGTHRKVMNAFNLLINHYDEYFEGVRQNLGVSPQLEN